MTYYTDATGDNGNSIISCKKKDGIIFEYVLKPGFDYPYAGISIHPDSGFLDLHNYKSIDITLSSDTICAVNIQLKTFQDSCTIPDNYITYRFLEYTLWVDTIPKVYRIDIASMKTPDWWYSVIKKDQSQMGKPDFRRVRNYDIATKSIYLQRPGVIHIHKMVLIRNKLPFILGGCIILITGLAAVAIRFLTRKNKKQTIISYQQLNNNSSHTKEDERITDFIGKKFTNSTLSVEMVGRETGVHWSRVTSVIKKVHNLTFKQYLNTIRIAEAKRLLIETDRQVLDIALTVGYGNVSHFNRVFKEYENCSPKEFRNKNISSDKFVKNEDFLKEKNFSEVEA